MPYSVVLDLDNGGQVTFDNVVSCTIEENEPPDEDLEEGEEEREGNNEVDHMNREDEIPLEEAV